MKVLIFLVVVFLAESYEFTLNEAIAKTIETKLEPAPFDLPNPEINRSGRIFQGSRAATGQFPHFALIFSNRISSTSICGGGLIATKWVLTAKHCVNDAISIELRFGLTTQNNYEQKIWGIKVARYEDADLALIELQYETKITNLVKPALLPRKSESHNMLENRLSTICGFGRVRSDVAGASNVLNFADMDILPHEKCVEYYGTFRTAFLCAKGHNSLSSPCPGDSGSPLVIKENNDYVVVGVVSFGAGGGCDFGFPVGFGRVSLQLDWIVYYTKITLRE
ncbi:CLUMA_CG011976, isoform A [Clunio marinus]|uniref:CLUMA_CG011976, isoform A n=1 Tax=Clunio marinus TaxID=568069 RepID=A0A1J1IHP1_9DIPT|nr:CLUMA_CG011976, isoform A [Clunio marinus]